MKKVALHNLGCKVNAYETEAMQELLEKHGMVSGKHQTNRKRKQRPIRRFWISIMKKCMKICI